MSLIFSDAKILDYETWLRRNPDAELLEEMCDECDGTGERECPECGHETECDVCDGTGVINSARDQYEQQVKHDKQAVRKYENWLTRAAEQRDEAVGQGADESPKDLRTEDK